MSGATARSVEHDRTTFRELGVSAPIERALGMRGIERPFAIQTIVLPDALAGRDVLARSRTGSGKTLAFAVPLVERLQPNGRSPSGLILAPTRELASQVTEEFRAIADVRHLQVAAVYGGVGIGPQAKRARRADIVVATPGRLLDLVARKLLRLDRVRACVLDEALTGRMFLSGAIVLASVALIVSSGSAARLPEDAGDAGAGVAREMAEGSGGGEERGPEVQAEV